jgi:hypothetical protein
VKERAQLEEMYHQGDCPWMIWDPDRSGRIQSADSTTGGADLTQAAGDITG